MSDMLENPRGYRPQPEPYIGHPEAMALAEAGDILRSMNRDRLANRLYMLACDIEVPIAYRATEQPSRAVLFRSAAWLAYNGRQFARAFDLSVIGLCCAPNGGAAPPEEIAAELDEVKRAAKDALAKEPKDGDSETEPAN